MFMSEEFELSDSERGKLLAFIKQFDQVFGDADFDAKAEWSTPELLALALRAAQILGYQGDALERFFAKEFDVAGVTEGDLDTMLAVAMMVDVEHRIRVAAGGRN
jgi:hypothetical protein